MKAFIEEYGLILVVVLVITVMVASANGMGGKVKDGIENTVAGMTDKMGAVADKFVTGGGSGGGSGSGGSEEPDVIWFGGFLWL